MEKVALSVRVPALNHTYDFMIPNNMKVSDVISLITKILISEYGLKENLEDLILIDAEDGKALRHDSSLDQQGIVDGAKFILL